MYLSFCPILVLEEKGSGGENLAGKNAGAFLKEYFGCKKNKSGKRMCESKGRSKKNKIK